MTCKVLRARDESGGFIMAIGSLTPLQPTATKRKCFSINDVRSLVSEQLGVDVEFVTSEAHFANDLGADLIDRVELMLAIEDRFSGSKSRTTISSKYRS